MGRRSRYSAEVRERGYSVKEVTDNLGVSRLSLYKWVREAKPSPHRQEDEEPLETNMLRR